MRYCCSSGVGFWAVALSEKREKNRKQGKYSIAVEVLKQAVTYNPRESRVHQFLARSYQKLGRTQKAPAEQAARPS
jgi:Flp pilus assembly protein TadD